MRLIDADALKSRIERMWKSRQLTNTKYKTFIELLDVEPTIEPERKKGRWISADAIFHGVPFYCSECGEVTRDTVMWKPRWNFCPICGARMEGTDEAD